MRKLFGAAKKAHEKKAAKKKHPKKHHAKKHHAKKHHGAKKHHAKKHHKKHHSKMPERERLTLAYLSARHKGGPALKRAEAALDEYDRRRR